MKRNRFTEEQIIGSFDPQLIAKYQRRFPGFDDKIISMYARGMSTREITGHLRELYGIEVSPGLISTVTDAVLEEVAAWQQRPLDPAYPLVFFDAIRVKIRDEGLVRSKVSVASRPLRLWVRDGRSVVRRVTFRKGCSQWTTIRTT
jgi:transposase-like protein